MSEYSRGGQTFWLAGSRACEPFCAYFVISDDFWNNIQINFKIVTKIALQMGKRSTGRKEINEGLQFGLRLPWIAEPTFPDYEVCRSSYIRESSQIS